MLCAKCMKSSDTGLVGSLGGLRYTLLIVVANRLVQVTERQLLLGSIRRSTSRWGTGVGRWSAVGTFRRKDESRSRDRSSARSFCTPGICTQDKSIWCRASKKNKHLAGASCGDPDLCEIEHHAQRTDCRSDIAPVNGSRLGPIRPLLQ